MKFALDTIAIPKKKEVINILSFLRKNIPNDKKNNAIGQSIEFVFSDNNKKHKVHLGILKKTSFKTKKLDKICSKFKKIDFIKIDVDGHELDVLKSGKKTIKKHKPVIYFEFAPYLYKEFGYSPKILINFIKSQLNYNFYDENLKKVININEFVKKLQNRSKNFFLFHKNYKTLKL